MSRFPSSELLARALPRELWTAAHKQAQRQALIKFNVGAVIFKDGREIARGCAHVHGQHSVHAEQAALDRLPASMCQGADIVIVTVARSGSWAQSSRPCGRCARYLDSRGVRFAHYAARDAAGVWSVRVESIADIAESSVDACGLYEHRPARLMKVPGIDAERIIA